GKLRFIGLSEGELARWSWDMPPRGRWKPLAPITFVGRRAEQRVWRDMKRFLAQTNSSQAGISRDDLQTGGRYQERLKPAVRLLNRREDRGHRPPGGAVKVRRGRRSRSV